MVNDQNNDDSHNMNADLPSYSELNDIHYGRSFDNISENINYQKAPLSNLATRLSRSSVFKSINNFQKKNSEQKQFDPTTISTEKKPNQDNPLEKHPHHKNLVRNRKIVNIKNFISNKTIYYNDVIEFAQDSIVKSTMIYTYPKYYNLIFLIRFILFGFIIIGLQLVPLLQTILLFLVQLVICIM